MPEDLGSDGVLVTFRDMYDQLQILVGELKEMNSTLKINSVQLTDLEVRVRMLEKWRYALPVSALLGLGSATTAIIALFIN